MTLAQTKKAMLEWTDFHGGDISDTTSIKNAKNKKELAQVLYDHESFLEMQLCDALSHIESFRKKLKLHVY